jgi:hypothetical protein
LTIFGPIFLKTIWVSGYAFWAKFSLVPRLRGLARPFVLLKMRQLQPHLVDLIYLYFRTTPLCASIIE